MASARVFPKERVKKKPCRPLPRRIHFGEAEVWTYKIIPGADLVIVAPDGYEKWEVRASDFSGWREEDIERGLGKGYFSITPKSIKAYIWCYLRPSYLRRLG